MGDFNYNKIDWNQLCQEFQFKCYFEQCNISEERWNYFKGNYEQMNKKLDLDLDKILTDINPNKLFNIFVEKFNKAKI